MSSFSLVLDELSDHEWDSGWLITGGGWNALCEMILIRPLTPPLSCCLGMCRWSSAGRTAPSASSEDGSPTARDSAGSPANTGSVSASGLWLRSCLCVFGDVWLTLMCTAAAQKPLESRYLHNFARLLAVSSHQQDNDSHRDVNYSTPAKKADCEIASHGDGARWRERRWE